jgi:hypothetical protein
LESCSLCLTKEIEDSTKSDRFYNMAQWLQYTTGNGNEPAYDWTLSAGTKLMAVAAGIVRGSLLAMSIRSSKYPSTRRRVSSLTTTASEGATPCIRDARPT